MTAANEHPDPDAEPEADAEAIRRYEDFHGQDTYSPDLGRIWFCGFCETPRSFSDVEGNCCPGRADQQRYEARHP